MTEYDLIRKLVERFPRSPEQLNGVFTCDAELLAIGDGIWAITVDEFTPEEDLFTSDDAELLGANLATATLSDLLAAGAAPAFFLSALALSRDVPDRFAEALCAGAASVLAEVGCHLCGGDLGVAETWRFTGVALGPVPSGRPLARVLPTEPQAMWVTGDLGDANLAAFLGTPTPRFDLRLDAARAVRGVATACTDTSGGLLDAVWCLASVSPGVRLELDLDRVPVCAGLRELSADRAIPLEAGLVGGAGEYELLFAAPKSLPDGAHAELDALATRIGRTCPSPEPGVFVRSGASQPHRLPGPPPCPRQARSTEEHVSQVIAYARSLREGIA